MAGGRGSSGRDMPSASPSSLASWQGHRAELPQDKGAALGALSDLLWASSDIPGCERGAHLTPPGHHHLGWAVEFARQRGRGRLSGPTGRAGVLCEQLHVGPCLHRFLH